MKISEKEWVRGWPIFKNNYFIELEDVSLSNNNNHHSINVTRKKSPNVYKSGPKMISLENDRFLTPLQKLPKNVGDLGKLIVAKGFKKLPKVQ